MEENKVQATSEPNPTGDDEVKVTDLTDGEDTSDNSAKAGEEKKADDAPEAKKEDDKAQAKAKQDRETDAKNAERRRKQKEKEREEAERKAREAEIRRQAVFEVKSGQVTADELGELGLSKCEDEDQLFLVESLRKAKAEGVENPQAHAYQALFKKKTEERAEAKAKAEAEEAAKNKQKETVANDQKAFLAKFGKSTAEVMKNEPEFMNLFGKLIDPDKGNFTELYSVYSEMKGTKRDDAKKDGSFSASQGNRSEGQGQSRPKTLEEFEKYWAEKYHS